MFEFFLYDLKHFSSLEKLFLSNNLKKEVVFLCVGTNSYFNDCFGPKIGDELKKLNFFVYGSSKREVNGLNCFKIYEFIKLKHKNCKVIILDSVFIKGEKKPFLIYKNSPIKISALNSDLSIGDEGILFNSFSYSKLEYINKVIDLIVKMNLKLN